VKPQDRKRLEQLGFAPEVIAKTEEVLKVWEVEELFVTCTYCGKPCFHPDLKRQRRHRKRLPADLFAKMEHVGFYDNQGEVICWPCDEREFQ
jgi:hypothetical protein